MTEAEWLKCVDLHLMVSHLEDKAGFRKMMLWAVASCRLVWESIIDTRSRSAIETAEMYADCEVTEAERVRCLESATNAEHDAHAAKQTALYDSETNPAWTNAYQDSLEVVHAAARAAARAIAAEPFDAAMIALWVAAKCQRHEKGWSAGYGEAKQRWAGNLRDIFGNPFRPVAFDRAWRTTTVTSLAEAIYAERAFDRLPILADALEDASCTSADVLEHCRQPGEHARGCWVVDLVLGKE